MYKNPQIIFFFKAALFTIFTVYGIISCVKLYDKEVWLWRELTNLKTDKEKRYTVLEKEWELKTAEMY